MPLKNMKDAFTWDFYGKSTSIAFQMFHGLQTFGHLYATNILTDALIVQHKGQIAKAVEVEHTYFIQEGATTILLRLSLKHVAHTSWLLLGR